MGIEAPLKRREVSDSMVPLMMRPKLIHKTLLFYFPGGWLWYALQYVSRKVLGKPVTSSPSWWPTQNTSLWEYQRIVLGLNLLLTTDTHWSMWCLRKKKSFIHSTSSHRALGCVPTKLSTARRKRRAKRSSSCVPVFFWEDNLTGYLLAYRKKTH